MLQRSLVLVLSIAFAATASAQSGSIVGRVVDQSTRAALPGAAIVVEGTSLSTVSDRDGRFRAFGHADTVVAVS